MSEGDLIYDPATGNLVYDPVSDDLVYAETTPASCPYDPGSPGPNLKITVANQVTLAAIGKTFHTVATNDVMVLINDLLGEGPCSWLEDLPVYGWGATQKLSVVATGVTLVAGTHWRLGVVINIDEAPGVVLGIWILDAPTPIGTYTHDSGDLTGADIIVTEV